MREASSQALPDIELSVIDVPCQSSDDGGTVLELDSALDWSKWTGSEYQEYRRRSIEAARGAG